MLKPLVDETTASLLTVYPGYAHHANASANSDWMIRLSGVVYQVPDEFSVRKRMMIRMLRNVMKVSSDSLECELFRSRITPFLSDAQHRRRIWVRLGDESFELKQRTRRNGHFESWLRVPAALVAELQEKVDGVCRIQYSVNIEEADGEPVHSLAYLHDRMGLCVVSDIDDTIKETSVTDRRELLANTFLREFRGVPGMRSVYQSWSEMGADFHYVSSSPWQLFGSLRQLQSEQGFPEGALHLRNFRLRDQLLKRVLIIRRTGKATAIRSLLQNLPERQFVLVGDSGEKDPEIYAKICRQFPGRIAALFIRELPARPMTDERRAKLDAVPVAHVELFRDASELSDLSRPIFAASE